MEPIKSITLAYNELIFAWKLSPFSFVRSYSTYCSTEIDWSHFRWYFLFVLCSKDHLETRRVYTCYTLTDTYYQRASLVAQMVKIPPAIQETGVQFLGQEDPLEKGDCYPFQYSCLENPMDSGAWGATVHGVTKSQT